jgi:co-chaperonin GroES (HSP10)
MRQHLLLRAHATPSILREWSLTPTDDRLMIKYASFREGYVCTACDGKGHSEQSCSACGGTKKVQWQDRLGNDKFEPCTHCLFTGSEAMTPVVHGKEPCETCKGNGLAKGVLAIPDEAKRDHSYGDIISIGDQVYDLAPGDRVCFSKMAGIHIHNDKVDTNKRETHYCLLRRVEVMGLMLRV